MLYFLFKTNQFNIHLTLGISESKMNNGARPPSYQYKYISKWKDWFLISNGSSNTPTSSHINPNYSHLIPLLPTSLVSLLIFSMKPIKMWEEHWNIFKCSEMKFKYILAKNCLDVISDSRIITFSKLKASSWNAVSGLRMLFGSKRISHA